MKILFPALLAAALCSLAPAQEAKPKPDLPAALSALESELAGLSKSLDQRKAEVERSHRRHHDEIDMYKKQAETLGQRLADMQKDNAAKAQQIADLQKKLADMTKSSTDAQAAIKRLQEQVSKLETAAAKPAPKPAPTPVPAPE